MMDVASEKDGAKAFRDTVALDESTIVEANWRGYARARDNGHVDFVHRAKLHDRYYCGDQWEEDVLATLRAQNRPAQTVNLVLSTVNAVVGEYLQARQDIDVKPVDQDADADTAVAIRKLMMHTSYSSKSKNVEKQVFMDGVINDRGFFDIRLDFTDNVLGEIKEISLDPVDVLVDPGARDYDPRTWSEVYVTRWMTPDEIEIAYGRDKGDAVRFVDESSTFGIDSVELDPITFSGKAALYSRGVDGFSYQDDWRQVRRLRVIERQYYKMATQRHFVDQKTGDTSVIPDDWTKPRIQAVQDYLAKQGCPVSTINRVKRRVRWTVTCDKKLLHDGWSPYEHYTVVPYFPYFRRGRGFGVVRNLIGAQDILNKVTSQELHVINTTANSGWIIEEGSLSNMTTQQLETVGAKTGLVLSHNKNTAAPAKIQPNQIPSGLDRVSQKTIGYFREISGVSEAMLGAIGREISGQALENKKDSGLVQLGVIFDNLSISRQIRAEIQLNLIQKFYTDTRVTKILGTGDEGQEQPSQVAINQPDISGKILNDVTLGEYHVVVSSMPSKDTESDNEMQRLLQLKQVGVAIPDWALIEASNISNRKELADWNRRMTGAAQPTEEEMQQAQQAQQMQMQMQVANIDVLRSKAQMQMAQAKLAEVQAEMMPEAAKADMQKFGAKIRQDMEDNMQELQQNREDLMTRIALMKDKTSTQRYQAGLQTLSARLETEAKERIAGSRTSEKTTSDKKRG
jgi:hypothetical protein